MKNEPIKKHPRRLDAQWDESVDSVDGVDYHYSATWIKQLEPLRHWKLYWKQQDVIAKVREEGDDFLEIGVGSGFAANYLRSKGHKVSTFDIDEKKAPDFLGNIVQMELPGKFDHLLAFEVFEHIPYDEFLKVLERDRNKIRKSLCFSVPIAKKQLFRFTLKLPKLRLLDFSMNVPKRKLWDFHFWEVDYKGLKQKDLISDLEHRGYKLRHIENYNLRLFVVCDVE